MQDKHYLLKMFILLFSTSVGIFAIWWAAIRPEGADWISGQIVHDVSPFAISEETDGTIVSNVIIGYEFIVPTGLKESGSKNLVFMSDKDSLDCQIKHWSKAVPQNESGEKNMIDWQGKNLYFTITTNQNSRTVCYQYFEQIKRSLSKF